MTRKCAEAKLPHGMCSLCGTISYQRSSDFICEDCGSPKKGIVYCASCGTRHEIHSTDDLIALQLLKIPECSGMTSFQGYSIKVSWCPECPQEDKNDQVVIDIYKIK